MENLMGFKEFYDVVLKSTYPIQIGNRTIQPGEVLARFDNIQIATLEENKQYTKASGGFENQTRVLWETTKEIDLIFSQGIFSTRHLTLMSNSKLIETKDDEKIEISCSEEVESNEEGIVYLKHPAKNLFIYNKKTGEKIENFELVDESTFSIDAPYTDLIVDYIYEYSDGARVVKVGDRLINGFVTLEGKTRVKEDITGIVKTGIIKIPKLKIVSELSMKIGTNANPIVANFKAIGFPTGSKGNSKVMDLILLNDDIDSDM